MAGLIAYIDSSVLLRVVLRAPGQLAEWDLIGPGLSSELLGVEVRRTLDRLWLQNVLTDDQFGEKADEADAILQRIGLAPLDPRVLERACQPFPTPLATLDALHLTTAILLRAQQPADEETIVFATHDRELAIAAHAMNFEVIGVPA